VALPEGTAIQIQDITSSKFYIVDNLKKALRIVDSVHNKVGENIDNHMRKENETILMNWNKFSFDQKKHKYSKSVCSEINFFLYHRDKEFYAAVVKPYIQNKIDKHLVDWYLLGLEQNADGKYCKIMLRYLECLEVYEELKVIEQCLVVDFAMKKGSDDQKATARVMGENRVADIMWENKI
jgi:hypothetical protein